MLKQNENIIPWPDMRSIQHLVLTKSWLGKIWEKLPSHISCHLMLSHAVSCRLNTYRAQAFPTCMTGNPPPAFMQDVTRQHTLHANKLDQNHQKRYHLSLRTQSRNDTRIKKAPHSQRSPSNGCADLFRFGTMMTR